MASELIDAQQDYACPYCNEALENFIYETVLSANGDQVSALTATCPTCGATASLSVETLVREVTYKVMANLGSTRYA